jgi:hypothetical protein
MIEELVPIEHGEHRAQHDHADGQGQNPRRHVVRLVTLDSDIVLVCEFHDLRPLRGGDFAMVIRDEIISAEAAD